MKKYFYIYGGLNMKMLRKADEMEMAIKIYETRRMTDVVEEDEE